MRTIEIATSQNVTIKFELAASGQRIMAFLLDLIFIFIYMWSAVSLAEILVPRTEFLVFLVAIPALFYSMITEYLLNGSTPGKGITGIKVIKMDGSEPELMDYFGRWSTRLIDLYLSGGSIALLLVSTTNNAQRLGDILSGTVVVRTKTQSRFTLAEILKLNNAENYVADYPEIKQLSEKDMVLVKRLVDRYEDHPNRSNKELIKETAEHLIKRLKINSTPLPDEKFLKALIKDYVILSR